MTETEKPVSEPIEDADTQSIMAQISEALYVQTKKPSTYFTVSGDNFCSGLVTKIFVVARRLHKIPFETCILCHTGIVCETTRGRAYMIEYCENFPVLTHDVTDGWSFKPTAKWNYGGYSYTRERKGTALSAVSYNVQYLSKLFQCSADKTGDYILSGNNCHLVQEHVRLSLGLAGQTDLHYGTCFKPLELDFDPLSELKPFYFM